MHVRKTLSSFDDASLIKDKGSELFNVQMYGCDGVDIFNFIMTILAYYLDSTVQNYDLHKDGSLILTCNKNGHKLDQLRKDLIYIFRRFDFRVTVNITKVTTLNITMTNFGHLYSLSA